MTAAAFIPEIALEQARHAFVRRSSLFSEFEALRILNGEYSGTPGWALDGYARHLVLFAYHESAWLGAAEIARPLAESLGALSLTLKDRIHKGKTGREASMILWGRPPETLWVKENGLRYQVELAHPFNVGLFLDTRPLRLWLKSCRPVRVLNLFSYTCSLGLAAAAAGCEVVNVDVSKRYLAWGRENFLGNDLPVNPQSFRSLPAERYLDWCREKGRKFDIVILDPPSFARFEGQTFSLPRDYPRLAAKSADLVDEEGTLVALTNFAGIDPPALRAWLEEKLPPPLWRDASWESVEPGGDFEPPRPWVRTEEGMLVGWKITRRA